MSSEIRVQKLFWQIEKDYGFKMYIQENMSVNKIKQT